MTQCSALWIDQKTARVFHVRPEKLAAPLPSLQRRRPKGPDGEAEHPTKDNERFFDEVARSLEATERLLLIGPAAAKIAFLQYVHEHDHPIAPKIVGLASVPHATDGQLAAYAKKYFRADSAREGAPSSAATSKPPTP